MTKSPNNVDASDRARELVAKLETIIENLEELEKDGGTLLQGDRHATLENAMPLIKEGRMNEHVDKNTLARLRVKIWSLISL